MPRQGIRFVTALAAFGALAGVLSRASAAPLQPIPQGSIAVSLTPVATGMAAPDYATHAPGDTSRLFVVEQNGLLRVIQNGVLQPGSALDIRNRVQIAPT